jgi:hypothetical protein
MYALARWVSSCSVLGCVCEELRHTLVSVSIYSAGGTETPRARVVEDCCKVWSHVTGRLVTLLPEELVGIFLYICT